MSPTRELAMQTWKEANKFAKQLDIRIACVYGGVGISDQIGDLKRGAEVIVCTVGRLTDMLAANKGKRIIIDLIDVSSWIIFFLFIPYLFIIFRESNQPSSSYIFSS